MFASLLSLPAPAWLRASAACVLMAPALAAALPPMDPPVQTVPTDYLQSFIGAEQHAVYRALSYADGNRQVTISRYAMPVDGSAASVQTSTYPAGFLPKGVAKGLVYGYNDQNGDSFPEDFRVLDVATQQLVVSYPMTTSLSSLKELRQEDGCIVSSQYLSSPIKLLRFNATTRTITESTYDLSALGNFSTLNLIGAGDGWLAFHFYNPLENQNKLVAVDSTTSAKKGEATVGGFMVADPMYAFASDTQFHFANGKILAMDVNTGASTFLGDGVAGAIKTPRYMTARGNELWVQGYLESVSSGGAELQMWRKGAGGQWQMEFRGSPDRPALFDNPFGELIATAEGCFSEGQNVTDYYVPALSRPILTMPGGIHLKDHGGKQKVTLKLDRPSDGPLSVRVRSAGGSATADVDYVAINKVVNFPAGSSEATLEVEVLADLVPESHETIGLIFSEPQGMYLPEIHRGHLIVDASGLQLTELKLLNSTGAPLTVATPLMRDPELTVGIAAVPQATSPEKICIWDNASGALRGITSVPVFGLFESAAEFLSTPDSIEVQYLQNGNIILARLNRQTGAVLSSASFPIPGFIRDIVLLGGGRALVSYSPSGNSSDWAARTIAIGGPAGGTAFPNPPPHSNGNDPTFISDGRYLIASWGSHSLSSQTAGFLGVFDPATLAPVWQMQLGNYAYATPIAIRGDMFLFGATGRVVAIDIPTRETLWEQTAEFDAGAVGDSIWYGGGYDPKAYDLATGALIDGPDYLAETTSAIEQVAVDGSGGIVLRDYEVVPIPGSMDTGLRFRLRLLSDRRTRPAVQLINQAVEQSHDGASFALYAVEKTNVPVQVSLYHLDANSTAYAKMTLDPNPVSLPMDGSTVGVPYRVQPDNGPIHRPEFRIGAKIEAPGIPPLTGMKILPMVSGIPIAAAHLGTVVATTPAGAGNPKLFGIRANDGKLAAYSGNPYGLFLPGPTHRVDVIDAASGNLLRRISDPVPLSNRMFGINAIAQGDKVLIISRVAGGETGTAEIFSISTGQPLAVLTYKGKLPGFGETLASNANYFAIGIPGMDLGKPAGSQVEVFRWADFKSAFRKAGGKNSGLGTGLVFKGDLLYVSAPGKRPPGKSIDYTKGKVFGFKIGAKAKGKLPLPTGTSGELAAGDSSLIVGNELHLRAYDWSTMQMKWSQPFKGNFMSYQGPIGAGSGMVSMRSLRDLILLSESDGSHAATARFSTEFDNEAYGDLFGAEIVGDSVFTLQDGVVTKWPKTALGDFSSWRYFQGLRLAQAGPKEDHDGNGIADFDDYVANRLNPAAPFATAVHENGKVRVDSAVLPPPDVLVVVEAEIEPGLWRAIAWREGHHGWTGPGAAPAAGSLLVDLPADSIAQPALRLRYLPSASFGAAWGGGQWPPEDRLEESGFAAKAFAAVADSDGDGLPDWLEAQLGVQAGGAPLGLISGPAGSGVCFLRPRDGSAAFDVESSADLQVWQSVKDDPGVEIGVVLENDQHERVTIRGKAGVGQRFFRVKY
ncbi:Calx-beta domain-containing protein [Haloferula sp. BvORR071]|uniref:Calx-beta domain-containing protein n=1 Tax=Haloferula sp. BvORR071 TaxID=1396141 RepID=UPI002240F867|nr:Calx-beta domain-containing protein [Haloferula sp. BvORR071]